MMIHSHPTLEIQACGSAQLRVLSYNVLAQANEGHVMDYCVPSILNWERRSRNMLKEILSYKADVICLQGVYF